MSCSKIAQDLDYLVDHLLEEAGVSPHIPTLAELVAERTLFVVSHSGGKDSQRMMLEVLHNVPRENIVVVHAALGEEEWEGARELAEAQAREAGVPFLVATATGKTFLSMVEHRFRTRPEVPSWPSASSRQCTSDLKRGPIQREVRRYAEARGYRTVVNCMGLRAEESPNRAKLREWKRDKRASNSRREWYDWLPIHGLTTEEVFAGIRAAGQEPHVAYDLGSERLSCVFCIYASVNDLRMGAILRPRLYAKYVALERRTGYTMHMSRKSLVELVGWEPEAALLAEVEAAAAVTNSFA